MIVLARFHSIPMFGRKVITVNTFGTLIDVFSKHEKWHLPGSHSQPFNYRDLDVSSNRLKWTFLEDYNSALRGCSALKFLNALEIDQSLLAHTPKGDGVPLKCKREHTVLG